MTEIAAELREARVDLARAIQDVGELFEGLADAEVPLTERTVLALRASRLVLLRAGREAILLADPEVPARVVTLAAGRLRELYRLAGGACLPGETR